jgi:hypothetical protein
MKYVAGIDSGAMKYIICVIKPGSGIQKLIGGIHIQSGRQQGDLISIHLFF